MIPDKKTGDKKMKHGFFGLMVAIAVTVVIGFSTLGGVAQTPGLTQSDPQTNIRATPEAFGGIRLDVKSPQALKMLRRFNAKLSEERPSGFPNSSTSFIVVDDHAGPINWSRDVFFTTAKENQGETYMIENTVDGSGDSRPSVIYYFPTGISGGAGFYLQNGNLSAFTPGGTMRFQVYIFTSRGIELVSAETPVFASEERKVPMIGYIDEVKMGNNYLITLHGTFDPNVRPIVMVGGFGLFPDEAIISSTQKEIKIFTGNAPVNYLIFGKNLLTVSQGGKNDSYLLRHMQ